MTARARWLRVLAAVPLLAVAAMPALAHERSASHSTWTFDATGADVTLRLDARDLTRPAAAARGDEAVEAEVAGAISAFRGGEPCAMAGPVARRTLPEGRVALDWRLACARSGRIRLESRLPELLAVPHLAFVRVVAGVVDREARDFEAVLHADQPAADQPLPEDAPRRGAFAAAVELGLRHIASGADHLLFVLGLVVVARTTREVAGLVTMFTAAHSLTLAAATLGWIRPAGAAIEGLIAASIALLAVENLVFCRPAARATSRRIVLVMAPAVVAAAAGFGRVPFAALAGTALFSVCALALADRGGDDRRLRRVVAFAFGLLHGFGFAGSLGDAGFPAGAALATLAGFNLGVEAGQLLFVLLVGPALALARRALDFRYAPLVVEPASVLLLAASVAWYVQRGFF